MHSNPEKYLDDIVSVAESNLFVQYIVDRIKDDNYRGLHISQHNRYDLERLTKIIDGMYAIVGNKNFRVPSGDDNRKEQQGCADYYNMVKEVKRLAGVGTVNSLKKNFFVDFHRAGLLRRFDVNKNEIAINTRKRVGYAELTPLAINMFQTDTIGRYRIFTEALDNLFDKELTKLVNVLYYSDYNETPITSIEFTLILSDNRDYIKYDKIELLNSYRSLRKFEREKILDAIKRYCNPSNFHGNKTKKRDFHNWCNETQQIFSLLNNTIYFQVTDSKFRLNTGIYGIFKSHNMSRSRRTKSEYFERHNLGKTEDFELHHIIPFVNARNKEELILIDNWKNLVYLKSSKHAQITRSGNKNVILYAHRTYLKFVDFDEKFYYRRMWRLRTLRRISV